MSGRIIILVNTGTPDAPRRRHVARYLSQFLGNRRVIDMPWLLRKLLVNLVIVPFRALASARRYKKVWTPDGSPLQYNLARLVEKVQRLLPPADMAVGAMNCGNPSIGNVLEDVRKMSPDKIVVFPLFPHYASSTVGSIYENIMRTVSRWEMIPEVHFTGPFYQHPSYIAAISERIRENDTGNYDHILFSYHGLPLRCLQKATPGANCMQCRLSGNFPPGCNRCYRMHCYRTTAFIAGSLGLREGAYSTAFQSRFSRKWTEPFTDTVLTKLPRTDKRNVLIVSPSFVADCLETTVELGEEYKEVFLSAGGRNLDVVTSLNDSDRWAGGIVDIIGVE
ncbi:MAG: ferrochelatase [Bacteroidales bacterium]|jgi:ferrochelatase|nr:ferrochelatase [Bacteroidales bacterium]